MTPGAEAALTADMRCGATEVGISVAPGATEIPTIRALNETGTLPPHSRRYEGDPPAWLILATALRPFFLAALRELSLDSAAAVSGRGSQSSAGAGGRRFVALGSVAVRMPSVWSHKRVSDFLKNLPQSQSR